MKLFTTTFATTLLVGALAACDQGSNGTKNAATAADGGGRAVYDASLPQGLDAPASNRPSYGSPIPFTAGNDLAYVDVMIPHLGEGVTAADQEIARGMRPDVKMLATRVRQETMDAIGQLQGARTALAGAAEPPTPARDPHAEQTMMQLMSQSGMSLDDLFLQTLIAHHAQDIVTSQRALPNLETMTVRGLADHLRQTDASEIGEAQALREKQQPPPPVDAGP
jgi:uncharacterized protein (DUF305 family)